MPAASGSLESVVAQQACATTSLQQAWLAADTSWSACGAEVHQPGPDQLGTPPMEVEPTTLTAPSKDAPATAAADSGTAASDDQMAIEVAAGVTLPTANGPLNASPLAPSHPQRGANGRLAQEEAAEQVQAAARAAQAESKAPSKRPAYKGRGTVSSRGPTQSTGAVYASRRASPL